MELTGQCKKDFYYWFDAFNLNNLELTIPQDFGEYPDSMKYGVYVDFFDVNKIIIELQVHVYPTMSGGSFKGIRPMILSDGRFRNVSATFGKRETAREFAIKKANEIYNTK